MNTLLRYGCAVLAGALAQPIWAAVWLAGGRVLETGRLPAADSAFAFGVLVAGWGGAIVLTIGVPVFELLRVYGKANARWLAAVGFALVAVPSVLLIGGGGLLEEFSRSPAHGAMFVLYLCLFSLHGSAGALAFLWAWRRGGGEASAATPAAAPKTPTPHSPASV